MGRSEQPLVVMTLRSSQRRRPWESGPPSSLLLPLGLKTKAATSRSHHAQLERRRKRRRKKNPRQSRRTKRRSKDARQSLFLLLLSSTQLVLCAYGLSATRRIFGSL